MPVESYLRREFQKISLLAMAQCRAPYKFPSDRASLQSLVKRINQARNTVDSSQVLEGAPKISTHPSDELWVWLSLKEDGSIQLTAFQGIEQTRITARIDATGEMGPCVADPCRSEQASGQDVNAPREDDDSSESTQLSDEDEDSQTVRAAEDLIFCAALVIMVSPEGVPGTCVHLAALGEFIHEKLKVPVRLAEGSQAGYNRSSLRTPMSSRQNTGEIIEIGPVDGALIHLRACVRGRRCSAWLTDAGRLVDLGSETVIRFDPDVGTTK
jgi:hypothetical protein